MKPLFEFITDPSQVEFEDEIVLVIKSFIKRKQQVSEILWQMFPHLPKVFEKNKFVFGQLLDTLNYYLLFGKEQILSNRDHRHMLIEIAKKSLFSTQPTISVHNSEGAMLLQLIFQILSPSQALDEFMEDILNSVMNRLTTMPMQSYLKRHLLLVFVSAMAYSPALTLSYLERNQLTEKIFS